MKKTRSAIYAFFIFFAMNGLEAQAPTADIPDSPIIELRASCFYPESSKFRSLFGNNKLNYQLTSSFPLYPNWCGWIRGINLWAAVDYYSHSGHTSTLQNKTSLRIVPLTLGVKYFLPAICQRVPINFYAAAGMKYYFVHNHNHSNIVKKTINKRGMGGTLEVGCLATLSCHLVVDLFAAYSFKSFGASSSSNPAVKMTGLDLGGLNIGAGFGYKF